MPENTPRLLIPRPLGNEVDSRAAYRAALDMIDDAVARLVHAHTGGDEGPLLTTAALAADVARANLLTNGGFEIWQRGNGAFTADGAYGPDRWFVRLYAGATLSVTKDTGTPDAGSLADVAATYVHGTAGNIRQDLENPTTFRSKTLSLSVRVKTNIANAVRLSIADGLGGVEYSAYHTGDNTWQTLTVTSTLPAGTTAVSIMVAFEASCTAYIDNAMLCISPVAVDYVPLTPAEEWARCLRYCWVVTLPGYGSLLAGWAGTTTAAYFLVKFPVRMAVAPSMTVTAADWAVGDLVNAPIDLTALALGESRTDGGQVNATVAAGLTAYRPYVLVADSTGTRVMVFVANP